MRISVFMPSTGLFYAPGLAKPVVIDTDQLPKPEAETLQQLAQAARLFDPSISHDVPTSPKVRDAQQFEIHVEDGGQSRTIRVAEPMSHQGPLADFVRLVREHARRARSKS